MSPGAEPASTSGEAAGRVQAMQRSAEGWHRVQLAVIGFIGLCGVLTRADPERPLALQVMAGGLALTALALACLATYMVATVAWPLRAGRMPAAREGSDPLQAASRRLARGVNVTFVAVAVLALGTATGWWPSERAEGGEGAALLSVSVADGRSFCGEAAASAGRALVLVADGERIEIPLSAVTGIRPRADC